MAGLTEDVKSGGAPDDQLSFQSLIDLTEERLKGKLSLLTDPEMSALEALQSDAENRDLPSSSSISDEHCLLANKDHIETSVPANTLAVSSSAKIGTDEFESTYQDVIVENHDIDGLHRGEKDRLDDEKEGPDDRKGSTDDRKGSTDETVPVTQSNPVCTDEGLVKEGEGAPIRSHTENKHEDLYADAPAGVSSKKQGTDGNVNQGIVYTMDKDIEHSQVLNYNDINGKISDCFVTRQSDKTMDHSNCSKALNKPNDTLKLNMGDLGKKDSEVDVEQDDRNKDFQDIQNKIGDVNDESRESSELQRELSSDSLISSSVANEQGNIDLLSIDVNWSKFESKNNDEPENHDTNDLSDNTFNQNNQDTLGDKNFHKESLTSVEAGAQKGIQIENNIDSSVGSLASTIQPSHKQMNESGLSGKRHEKANDLHEHPKENEDDSLSSITIVSVTGAVTSDNEKLDTVTDERIENTVGILEKTDTEATNTGNNLLKIGSVSSVNQENHEPHLLNEEGNVKTLDCFKDTDIPVHEEMDVTTSTGTQIDTMSNKDGPGPLMISNVISLMDHDNALGETTSAVETYNDEPVRGGSNSALTIAVNKASCNTSKSIDALQDMCSSVPMPVARFNINSQDRHSNSLLNNAPGEITGQPDDHTVSLNVKHVSEAPVSDLPVISDVYSIKEESQDVYGEYSLAEGATQVRTDVVSNTNYKPTEVLTVSNPETENNDEVIQRKMTDLPVVKNTPLYTIETDQSKKPFVLQIQKTNDRITNIPTTTIKTVEGNFQNPITTCVMVVKNTLTSFLKKQVHLESQDNHSLPTLAPKVISLTNDLNDMKMEPLSIRTVGVTKITELIARKNPIPTYKPPAVPEGLKSLIKVQQQFPCYECGDTFLLKKSLHDHLSRRSMNINFKCETCRKNVNFTNKCQMLSHLRSHLNIHKTQAVPIHIKSDSIEISTFYDELCQLAKDNKKFKFFDDTTNEEDMSYPRCLFCNYKFTSSLDRKYHYLDSTQPKSITYCDACPMYLHNTCSMQAHKLIHEIQSVDKAPKTLICPECGDPFPFEKHDAFLWHIKMHCFHLSRYGSFSCKKCKHSVSSLEAGRYHLLSSLAQYYKCELCPMALRSVKNLYAHFYLKHAPDLTVGDSGGSGKPRAKIIYRCHYCDTLIDDREFLETHIESHITEMKALASYTFHCLQCGQFFYERADLINHATSKHKILVKRLSFCTFCQKDIGNMFDYVLHVLMKHLGGPSPAAVKFCDYCGLVCANEQWLQSHACLTKIWVYGDHTATPKNCPQQSTKGSRKEGIHKHAAIMPKPLPLSTGLSKERKTPNKKTSEIGFHSTCKACGSTFNDEDLFAIHIKSHRDANVFICTTCGDDSFKTFNEVQKHEVACAAKAQVEKTIFRRKPTKRAASKNESSAKIKITRSENDEFSVKLVPAPRGEVLPPEVEHKCDQCEAVFTRKTKLEEHKKSDHGLHPCHLCGLMHDSRLALKKHLILSHEGKKMRYNCFVCKNRKVDKYFTERSKLEKHLRQKHRLKQWDSSRIVPELPGLEGKGISPEPVKRKMESESESSQDNSIKKPKIGSLSTLKCAKCLFTCDSRDDFLLHIKEHNDPVSVQCLECGLCFAVLPSLRKHLFMVHKVRDFDAYCTTNKIEEPKEMDVERTPRHDNDVNVDVEKNDEEEPSDANPLECQVCYKQFDTEAGMRSHMRVHGMALIKRLRRGSGHTRNKSLSASRTGLSDDSSAKSSYKPDSLSTEEKSESSTPENVYNEENPVTSKQGNVSPDEKPGSSKPDNISNEEKPDNVSNEGMPVSSKPGNISIEEKLENSKPDNISTEEKPVSSKPDNVCNEDKPVSSKPDNISIEEKLESSKSDNISNEDKSVSSKSDISNEEKPERFETDNVSNEEKKRSRTPDEIYNEEKPVGISNEERPESLSIESSASTYVTQESETDNETNNVTSEHQIENISPECSIKE